MNCLNWIRGAAVTLATVGTMIPAVPAVAADQAQPARPGMTQVNAQMFDIALAKGGTFTGRVVDHTGSPMEGAQVVIKQGNKEVAQSVTDKTGTFSAGNLKPGMYTVSSGNTEGTYRLWAENTAPPSAKEMGLLVMGENGARGNFGTTGSNGWMIVAITVAGLAGIATAIAVGRSNLHKNPASP